MKPKREPQKPGTKPGAKPRKELSGLSLGKAIGVAIAGDFEGRQVEKVAHSIVGIRQMHSKHPDWPQKPEGLFESMLYQTVSNVIHHSADDLDPATNASNLVLRWIATATPQDFRDLATILESRPPTPDKWGVIQLPPADPPALAAILIGMRSTPMGSFTVADIKPSIESKSAAELAKLHEETAPEIDPETTRKQIAKQFGVKRKPGRPKQPG